MSILAALVLAAQNINPPPPVVPPTYVQIRQMPVPVTAMDVTDRPYRVIAEVRTNVRQASRFHPAPSEAKVYRELWERARKLGADAVVNARYGESIPGGWAYAQRKASGQAIKFLTDAEIRRFRGER
jgi:hypothetical protein